jgi:hypothetical protein
MLEAAITPQLITCVAGMNSGIHIFRKILNYRLAPDFRQAPSTKSHAAIGQSRPACFEVDSDA